MPNGTLAITSSGIFIQQIENIQFMISYCPEIHYHNGYTSKGLISVQQEAITTPDFSNLFMFSHNENTHFTPNLA